jgi:hypothetical protein
VSIVTIPVLLCSSDTWKLKTQLEKQVLLRGGLTQEGEGKRRKLRR